MLRHKAYPSPRQILVGQSTAFGWNSMTMRGCSFETVIPGTVTPIDFAGAVAELLHCSESLSVNYPQERST